MLPIQALSIRMWATMFQPRQPLQYSLLPNFPGFIFGRDITRRASSSFTADIDSSLQLFQ